MQIKINIPLKSAIISGGFVVSVCQNGKTSWNIGQIFSYAQKRGVYIHHSGGEILYVGKATDGKIGVFGERLRREFHHTASNSSALFKLLASQTNEIRSYLLDLDDIDMMVDPGSMSLAPIRKALIMEQVLIGLYNPVGNRI